MGGEGYAKGARPASSLRSKRMGLRDDPRPAEERNGAPDGGAAGGCNDTPRLTRGRLRAFVGNKSTQLALHLRLWRLHADSDCTEILLSRQVQ